MTLSKLLDFSVFACLCLFVYWLHHVAFHPGVWASLLLGHAGFRAHGLCSLDTHFVAPWHVGS